MVHHMHPEYDTVFPPAASILKLNISKGISSGRDDSLSISAFVSSPFNLIVDILSFPMSF